MTPMPIRSSTRSMPWTRLEERADFSARARHHLPHPCQPELHQEPGTRHPRQVPDRPGAGRNLQHGASDRLSDDARGELYDPVARNDDPQREIHLRSGDHRHQRRSFDGVGTFLLPIQIESVSPEVPINESLRTAYLRINGTYSANPFPMIDRSDGALQPSRRRSPNRRMITPNCPTTARPCR